MKDRLEYQATCEFIKEKFLHQIDFTDDTILKSERKYAKAFSDSACDFYFGFTNSVLFTSKGVFSPKTQKNHNFDTINKMINVDKFLKKGLYLNDGNNDNKLGESIPESILEQFAFETEDKMLFVTRRIQIMKMQKRLDLKIKEKEEAEEAEAEAARKVIIAEAEAARKVIITDLYNKIKANSITVLDVKSAVSKARKVIKENETHISKLNNEIGLNKRSILHENELKKFPSQAIGTITLYNKLFDYLLYQFSQVQQCFF